jgi:hypothetical protein
LTVLDRLVAFLPKQPPDWLIGFWTLYGAIFVLSLFLQEIPHDLTNQLFYWGRLAVGLICLIIALGLGWRRSHPS